MAAEIIDYAVVFEEMELDGGSQNTCTMIELKDEIQITDKTNPGNGVQMIVDKANLDSLVEVINDNIESEGEESKFEVSGEITEKFEPDDGDQIMEEKTDLDCVVQVKNGESDSEVGIQKKSGIESKGGKQEKIKIHIRPEFRGQKQIPRGIEILAVDQMKNSTGNAGIPRGGGKVPSRYLWAAMGSCHDSCKYGIKHGSKSEERRLVWERVPAKGERSNRMANGMIEMKKVQSKSSALPVLKRSSSETAINNLQTGSSSKRRSESTSGSVTNSVMGKRGLNPPVISFSRNTKAGKNLRGSSNKNIWKNAGVLKPEQTSNDDDCHEMTLHMIEPAVEEEPDGSTLSGEATGAPSSALSLSSPPRLPPTSNIYDAAMPGNTALGPVQPEVCRVWVPSRSPSPLSSPSASPSYMSDSSSSHRCKVRPKICSVVASENNFIPTRKLSFRTGKVLELPKQQISAPRRLKFRQPRLLGDMETCQNDYRKGTVKRKGVYENQKEFTKGESEKIILRHRMVEGKKMMRCLYNNAIEETASQLAHTRKSKVKALVGAFETVISLDSSTFVITHGR